MTESQFICSHCNEIEFGKDWINHKGRVITRFSVPFNEELLYAVARHDYDKHGINHGKPDNYGILFMNKVKSDEYKNTDLGNVVE